MLYNYYRFKPKYLAVNCYEISKYKKMYPNEAKFFLSYFKYGQSSNIYNPLPFLFKRKSIFFKEFIDYLKNKTNFCRLIKNKNISFELIFNEILYKLINQLDSSIKEYGKVKKIINKIKPLCVVFQSTTPFNSANVTFRKNCIESKIPFITWAHGGYGLTYSLSPYDNTDFRFCKNHISYGSYLNDLVKNDKCILKNLKLSENLKILPVGSLRFDYDNKNNNLKKIFKKNEKKTVLFLTGNTVRQRNQYYFGINREKNETSFWEFHYDILCLLQKYRKKYNGAKYT